VVQNVEIAMLGSHRSRRERSARALALLAEVGLEPLATAAPPTLSGGERQRVAVARALANDPPVVLADEPTGNLDPEATTVITDLLRCRCDDHGATVVIVSHDPLVLAQADRELRLAEGVLVPVGPRVPAGDVAPVAEG
jgi:putative ABC transport system ATP-binding protein